MFYSFLQTLMRKGANPMLKDGRGETAWDMTKDKEDVKKALETPKDGPKLGKKRREADAAKAEEEEKEKLNPEPQVKKQKVVLSHFDAEDDDEQHGVVTMDAVNQVQEEAEGEEDAEAQEELRKLQEMMAQAAALQAQIEAEAAAGQ